MNNWNSIESLELVPDAFQRLSNFFIVSGGLGEKVPRGRWPAPNTQDIFSSSNLLVWQILELLGRAGGELRH